MTPPCAAAMGCFCACHAAGLCADEACDTNEQRARAIAQANREAEDESDHECESGDLCDLCKARQHETVINIRLVVQGAPGDALTVVDTMLDNGDPQETINEHEHGDAGPLHVLDARVTEGDHSDRLAALDDVVALVFPDPETRGLPDVLLVDAIRKRLAFLKPEGR